MSKHTYFHTQITLEKGTDYHCIVRDEQSRTKLPKEEVVKILQAKSECPVHQHKIKFEAELITSEQADGYELDVVTIGGLADQKVKKELQQTVALG